MVFILSSLTKGENRNVIFDPNLDQRFYDFGSDFQFQYLKLLFPTFSRIFFLKLLEIVDSSFYELAKPRLSHFSKGGGEHSNTLPHL